MIKLSENLKKFRNEKGISQKDISNIIGISDRNYQRYEYGEREPIASILCLIADFYKISLDELVGRELKK